MKCPFVIKVCTKCKRILVANEMNFYKGNSKYGLHSKCKICERRYRQDNKEKIKEYKKQYYEDNKEKIKEYKKQYYEEHKEEIKEYKEQYCQDNKEKIKEYKKQYYEEHKEGLREWRKQYYEEHKEESLEKYKQYRENNPEKIFNYRTKYRMLKKSQGRGITREQWYEMMNYFDWKCAYSGEYLGGKLNENIRSVDHIVPLSLNGENEIWNCVPMLKLYNSSKSTKNMIDWYIQQEFFDIDRLLKIYDWIEYAYKKWNNQ